jgi:hypothetical protein
MRLYSELMHQIGGLSQKMSTEILHSLQENTQKFKKGRQQTSIEEPALPSHSLAEGRDTFVKTVFGSRCAVKSRIITYLTL